MKTVYVGLSGGVDSSVAAALLSRQGFNVVGVYMKNWTADVAGVACPWRLDLSDAKAVAAQLDLPFKVFDFQAEYRGRVVDAMVKEYRRGQTPNPDISCNQEIKFKLFLETALDQGADLIATGHYAQVESGQLKKGIDPAKDQSYFLYRVTEAALRRTLMPIGQLKKSAVRQMAAQLGLATASKPDSQGICFVGEVGIKAFLSQYLPNQPGPIVNQDGQVVGQHDGAWFYTLGQRHGLGVGGGSPFYVTDKDMTTNTIRVANQASGPELLTDHFTIGGCHWINQAPRAGKSYQVLTRYRGNLIDCRLEPVEDGCQVLMSRTERAVTPGQSAVIYDGDRVVGGGIIESVISIKDSTKDFGKSEKTIVKAPN